MCAYMCMMCVGTYVLWRMQGAWKMTCGVSSSLLLLCMLWGLNSGHQTYIIWQEVPLPSEPPHCPVLSSPLPFPPSVLSSSLLLPSLFLPVLLPVSHVVQDGLRFAM